jgi:hypothetical protein
MILHYLACYVFGYVLYVCTCSFVLPESLSPLHAATLSTQARQRMTLHLHTLCSWVQTTLIFQKAKPCHAALHALSLVSGSDGVSSSGSGVVDGAALGMYLEQLLMVQEQHRHVVHFLSKMPSQYLDPPSYPAVSIPTSSSSLTFSGSMFTCFTSPLHTAPLTALPSVTSDAVTVVRALLSAGGDDHDDDCVRNQAVLAFSQGLLR